MSGFSTAFLDELGKIGGDQAEYYKTMHHPAQALEHLKRLSEGKA